MRALVLCIALAVSTPAVASGQGGDLFARAKQAWTQRDFPTALKLLREVYARDGRPLVLYNIGRVLEELGRLTEAHAVFLRVLAHPKVSPPQRQMAANEAARLSPLLKVAVLRLGGIPSEAVVQVDGSAAARDEPDVTVSPGTRQVCVMTRGGGPARCWSLALTKGARVAWPFPSGPRGVMTLPPGLTRVDLNGHALVVDPGTLSGVEVEARVHRVRIQSADRVHVSEIFIAAGQTAAVTWPTPPLEPASAGVAPWVTIGLGVAALGAGTVALALGHGKAQEVSGAPVDASGRRTGMTESEALRRWEQAKELSTAGIIMTAIGAGTVLSGAIWAALSADGEQRTEVHVVTGADAWLVGVGGRF